VTPAVAGQEAAATSPEPTPAESVGVTLPAEGDPRLVMGGWTLRWAGDCWTVGRWDQGKRRRRWRRATWYGRLDQALRAIFERNVRQGSFQTVGEAVARVERVYASFRRDYPWCTGASAVAEPPWQGKSQPRSGSSASDGRDLNAELPRGVELPDGQILTYPASKLCGCQDCIAAWQAWEAGTLVLPGDGGDGLPW
jgi:hypothetical protein